MTPQKTFTHNDREFTLYDGEVRKITFSGKKVNSNLYDGIFNLYQQRQKSNNTRNMLSKRVRGQVKEIRFLMKVNKEKKEARKREDEIKNTALRKYKKQLEKAEGLNNAIALLGIKRYDG